MDKQFSYLRLNNKAGYDYASGFNTMNICGCTERGVQPKSVDVDSRFVL